MERTKEMDKELEMNQELLYTYGLLGEVKRDLSKLTEKFILGEFELGQVHAALDIVVGVDDRFRQQPQFDKIAQKLRQKT